GICRTSIPVYCPWTRLVIDMAGEAAEQFYFDRKPPPHSGDIFSAYRNAGAIFSDGSLESADLAISLARKGALDRVERNSEAILRLARELDRYRYIEGRDVHYILGKNLSNVSPYVRTFRAKNVAER